MSNPHLLDSLQYVSKLITHTKATGTCPDGMATAMIVHNALPTIQVVFMQYQSKEHYALPAEPGLLFCDFTPPRARIQEFIDARSIVLDHHDAQRADVELFGPLGVFADEKQEPGVSGAVLAYRHFWLNVPWNFTNAEKTALHTMDIVKEFARLAGIRDTWQRESPDWVRACCQAEALFNYPSDYWLQFPLKRWPEIPDIGRPFYEKTLRHVANMKQQVVSTVLGTGDANRRVAILPTTGLDDLAEVFKDDHDFVVGFKYIVEEGKPFLILSFRSGKHNDLNLGGLARTLNPDGGGHIHAASCRIEVSDGDGQPYRMIPAVLRHGLIELAGKAATNV